MDDELDSLFMLPLAEFTDARNALAARLKREKRPEDSARVKALGKPSVSAWAVNQLYWKHRDAFDRLNDSGQRFREAQSALFAGKNADLRGPTDARRAALSELGRLAASLLTDAGHNPAPDTIRRISATLEAMSVHSTLPDGQTPGHLTKDIDPPGFDSLSTFPVSAPPSRPKPIIAKPETNAAAVEEALQHAQRRLTSAHEAFKSAELELRHAEAESKKADRNKQTAEEQFNKAVAAAETAAQNARRALAHMELQKAALKEAEHEAEKALREFKSLK